MLTLPCRNLIESTAVRSIAAHIPFAWLVDLTDDRLGANEQQLVHDHISTCGACAADRAWVERVIDLMRTDDSIDPPAPVVARAVGLFQARNAVARPALRQILRAALRFDSARMSAAPALRSRVPLERQLLFTSEGYNLDLRIRPQGPLWSLSGQVFGTAGGEQIELNGPTGSTQSNLNTLSEFRLPPIPAGSYNLTLRLERADVEIAGLEIGV
jgi:hypothetical protein